MALSQDSIQREDLLKIVNAGIQAPSGDNCQPWQIFYHNNRLSIKLLEQKDRSLYNFNNSASLIAIGAMIENMSIVAGSLGFDMSVSLFLEKLWEGLLITVFVIVMTFLILILLCKSCF